MESFISEGSEDESHHLEDDQHVTEVKQINGRQSFQKRVDAILPRRMSRSRSHNVLSPSTRMVIGVSVEQATAVDGAHTHPDGIHTTIEATRSRDLPTLSTQPAKYGLVQRAKTFARKLGRKRKPRDEEVGVVRPTF